MATQIFQNYDDAVIFIFLVMGILIFDKVYLTKCISSSRLPKFAPAKVFLYMVCHNYTPWYICPVAAASCVSEKCRLYSAYI